MEYTKIRFDNGTKKARGFYAGYELVVFPSPRAVAYFTDFVAMCRG